MAELSTNNTRPAFSLGPVKMQVIDINAGTGVTSGTITAKNLKRIDHIYCPGMVHTAAPTVATNVATLAFTVPAETAATLSLGGVTYTAVSGKGSGANSITVAYTTGGTAGSEVVTVTGLAISVQIQSGTSTITQVRTAVNASAPAAALVTATGTSASTVASHAAAPLTGGVNGGNVTSCMAFGI